MASLTLNEVTRPCRMTRMLGHDQNFFLSPGCAFSSPHSQFWYFTYLPTQSFGMPSYSHSISAMEVIKDLFMCRWYGPPQELEKSPTMRVRRKSAKKMQFLEKYIPLPKEFQLDGSQPVFNLLCEDAVMFYTVCRSSTRKSGPNHDATARSRRQHNTMRALVHVLNVQLRKGKMGLRPTCTHCHACLCENKTLSYLDTWTRASRKEECMVIGYGKRSAVLLHPRSGSPGVTMSVPLECNSETEG